VPPLPALLADAAGEVLGDGAPAALPVLINQPAAGMADMTTFNCFKYRAGLVLTNTGVVH